MSEELPPPYTPATTTASVSRAVNGISTTIGSNLNAPSYDISTLTYRIYATNGCEKILSYESDNTFYFLESSTNIPPYHSPWDLTLYKIESTSRSKTPILKILKSLYSTTIYFESCTSGWKRKMKEMTYTVSGDVSELVGLEDVVYHWKKGDFGEYVCRDRVSTAIVAHLIKHGPLRSLESTRGEIHIHPDFQCDNELLLASALALEALTRVVGGSSQCNIM